MPPNTLPSCQVNGIFCDPQLGCSNRLVAEDLNEEHAWQFNQEFRLASNLSGPLNFSFGGNYMHYETEENYYVFFNTLTMYEAKFSQTATWDISDPSTLQCVQNKRPLNPADPGTAGNLICLGWIDPNPLGSLDGQGHNYFLSQNHPNFEEDAFGVLGARVSYLYEPWQLRVTVFGQNILDEYYTYGAMGTDFGPLTTAVPPATYGVRLNWEF